MNGIEGLKKLLSHFWQYDTPYCPTTHESNLGWFIWSSKVSDAYLSAAFLAYAMTTLVWSILTLVC